MIREESVIKRIIIGSTMIDCTAEDLLSCQHQASLIIDKNSKT